MLDASEIAIIKPTGEAATIYRCDTNGDKWVDINDIRAISLMRNQLVTHPDDPMDWDKNGVINVLDARGCQLACAEPHCALKPPEEPVPEIQVGGTTETGECSQSEDLDNDGEADSVIAISGVDEEAEQRDAASVSYKDGDPSVLYFWEDGVLKRAPYGVDD